MQHMVVGWLPFTVGAMYLQRPILFWLVPRLGIVHGQAHAHFNNSTMNFQKNLISLLFFQCIVMGAGAQTSAMVQVEDAWARATVPGQSGTGAFMKLTAAQGASLVGASSAAAGIAEVHEMKMEGDVMKMRAIGILDLPAGKAVQLRPGGYHIMLLDLKVPLNPNTTVPLTLTFKDVKGTKSTLDIVIPVRTDALAKQETSNQGHAHKH